MSRFQPADTCVCVCVMLARAGSCFVSIIQDLYFRLYRDVCEHLYMQPVHVCELNPRNVCVWVPDTLGKAAGAPCVWFFFSSRAAVLESARGGLTHVAICVNLYLTSAPSWHFTPHHLYATYTSRQTWVWKQQHIYGRTWVSGYDHSYNLKYLSLFFKQEY